MSVIEPCIPGGRVAALSVPNDHCEQVVTIVEATNKGSSDKEVPNRLQTVRQGELAPLDIPA